MARKISRASDMFPLVERYLESGKQQSMFCKENEIALHQLHYWLKKYREEKEDSTEEDFAPLSISNIGEKNIVIRYSNGTEIHIPFSC